MPIYDYHCTACGVDSEVMHKISDPPATKCPECGKNKLVKQVSASGFRLSGGGWYETDFKKSGDKKKNLAGDSTGKSDSAGKSESAACTPSGCDKPACATKSEAAA